MVYWLVTEWETADAAGYVAGTNDLWAVRFMVWLSDCKVEITDEH
jgi:hypothetical protein